MTDPFIQVPLAPGELVDKITILEIKTERIEDPAKLVNVRRELDILRAVHADHRVGTEETIRLGDRLKNVNERLWDLEDQIRDLERRGDFGPGFVEAARSIYRTNDERAALKRDINLHLGSAIVEEKSYADY
jgi:hypothetical protein